MKLFIDTSDRYEIAVALDEKTFKTEAKNGSSQKLLAFIDEILKKENTSINQIKEICVAVGPGSFTGLRVGVAVANTLGWSLNIPVNGKNLRKGEVVEIKYEK